MTFGLLELRPRPQRVRVGMSSGRLQAVATSRGRPLGQGPEEAPKAVGFTRRPEPVQPPKTWRSPGGGTPGGLPLPSDCQVSQWCSV